ncbi:phosphate acetyltransferase [Sulfurimonas sp. HSL-1656]|uniref:phosphate acetyltransferase n=1 Tax=Thiomicrolovo subterrani TaxID=3131934 RepID=UPI0031F99647
MNAETARSLYIVSKTRNAGSILVALGMTELLLRLHGRVAFFRPLIPDAAGEDPDTRTILSHFALEQPYESAVGLTVSEAETLLSEGKTDRLMETIIERHDALLEAYDFVLCQGVVNESLAQLIDFDLNVEIAKNLSAPVVGVVPARGMDETGLKEALRLWSYAIKKQGISLMMLFANRCDAALYENHRRDQNICPEIPEPVVLLPEVTTLDRPNVLQLAEGIGAEVLIGTDEQLHRLIDQPRVAAMHLEHFLTHIRPNDLIITPSDRADIILGATAANYAGNYPAVSAVLLTGETPPAESIIELLRGLDAMQIPLLYLPKETIEAVQMVRAFPARIDAAAPKKIATALGVFNQNVDAGLIEAKLAAASAGIVTPAMFEHRLFARAAADRKTIILPETSDDRILRAADILLRRRAVGIVLLGKAETIAARAAALGLDLRGATIVDPDDEQQKRHLAKAYARLRAHKGVSLEAAYDALGNATLFATMMVAEGACDGMVSGATHTTRETILPALQTIKTAPGQSLVSSCFFMCFDTRVLVYADCAVNPDPDAAQLAEIAIASAETALRFGIEARVAMLSYSTGNSGVGSDVEKVREATKLVREKRPDLAVDGPIQYDAAIDPEVGAQKMPGSAVAGQATVFIFPDLNTGNNTYKAVQRSAGAVAVGPVLQGLNRPVNDLSRGCSVADIVNTVAITAIQAQESLS